MGCGVSSPSDIETMRLWPTRVTLGLNVVYGARMLLRDGQCAIGSTRLSIA